MIRAIVIDEHASDVESLCNQLRQAESRIKIVKKFQDATDAERYFTKFPVDLVFLSQSKMESQTFLTGLGQNISIVYITADLNPNSSCVRRKNIDQDVRVFESLWVSLVLEKRTVDKDEDSFFVRADFELHKIFYNEIIYAESLGDYIKFVLDGKRPLVVKMSMKTLEETLPKTDFARVHRSYILKKNRIDKVKAKSVLINNLEITVGTTYLNRMQEILL
jgi:LytTr DNA-binding domain